MHKNGYVIASAMFPMSFWTFWATQVCIVGDLSIGQKLNGPTGDDLSAILVIPTAHPRQYNSLAKHVGRGVANLIESCHMLVMLLFNLSD